MSTSSPALPATDPAGPDAAASPLRGRVLSVGRDDRHRFSKPVTASITLIEGLGVEGDAHAGATTRHRYLVKKDPARANLTQVHLIQAELFDELALRGFDVTAGDLGENVTTTGVDLLSLPLGTRLRLGGDAVVEITGLRSPCFQIESFCSGLLKQVIGKDASGTVVRRTGVMGIVLAGGVVEPGDGIEVLMPAGEHRPLGVV